MLGQPTWNLLEVAGLLVAAAGVWFVFLQVRNARIEFELEHIRQRRLRTFELYDERRDRLRGLHLSVKGVFRSPVEFHPLGKEEAVKLRADTDLRKEAIDLLSSLERLAIGVKHDVYDEETIYSLSRAQLISYWSFYEEYIRLVRKDTPNAYESFEEMIETFIDRSRKDLRQLPKSRLLRARP
jgi:hypothetical protein